MSHVLFEATQPQCLIKRHISPDGLVWNSLSTITEALNPKHSTCMQKHHYLQYAANLPYLFGVT